jgi:cobalt-zinc-cadmium efflux system protein
MLGVGLTGGFVIIESLAGWFGHSLALLSDAGHNLADVLALLVSWYALRAAQRPSDARRTYGSHRIGIFAALLNAFSLVVIAGLIVIGAVERFLHPVQSHGWLMAGVAAVAVLLNTVIAMWLQHAAHDDLNVRGAYLHMLGDALSAAGVVVAGIVIGLNGPVIADPIVSLLIAVMIFYGSWSVLKESLGVLLEAVPAGIDMALVESAIRSVAGVSAAHDLHVWTIGPGVIACSCHIVVAEQSIRDGQQVRAAVQAELDRKFHINHTTLQVEVECCGRPDLYCSMQKTGEAPAGESASRHLTQV